MASDNSYRGLGDKSPQFLNLKYDLTPQKYLSMIVCEIGNIPPHSVPVVIREIMHDIENDEEYDDEIEEESSSEGEGDPRWPAGDDDMKERDDEQESSEEEQDKMFNKKMDKREQDKQKRI